ncbi:F-box protein At5g07610-like [Bidens hawaiensis]|uniref:F-box protein At5g07610-like n=1 Tax=Bidens hawaiensis TaxID=980011 RepID=UPI00404B32D2
MKTMAEDSSELVSSTHAVLSNDDLLIDILLRLPVVSLHVFKHVSKRWLPIISNPNFTLPHSPFGLILPRQTLEYDFAQLYTINSSIPPSTFTIHFDSSKLVILQSCNGLLLCRSSHDKLYVYNPSLQRFKRIPQCGFMGGVRMAFDPSKSAHYKLVCAGVIHTNEGSHPLIEIHVYSSKTCERSVCNGRFTLQSFRGFNNGIYWNDAIHWLDTINKALHVKFCLEHKVIKSTQTPGTLDDGEMVCDQKLFESRGCLLLLRISCGKMIIHKMSKGDSGWSMKYNVKLDGLMKQFPGSWFCSIHVRCIMIGKKDVDSFLVMEICGMIVRYNIASNTLCKLYDLESSYSPACFQYIASVAGV